MLFVSDESFDPRASPVVARYFAGHFAPGEGKWTEFDLDKEALQRELGPTKLVDCMPLLHVSEPDILHATG
jgi:hypothetical protein